MKNSDEFKVFKLSVSKTLLNTKDIPVSLLLGKSIDFYLLKDTKQE